MSKLAMSAIVWKYTGHTRRHRVSMKICNFPEDRSDCALAALLCISDVFEYQCLQAAVISTVTKKEDCWNTLLLKDAIAVAMQYVCTTSVSKFVNWCLCIRKAGSTVLLCILMECILMAPNASLDGRCVESVYSLFSDNEVHAVTCISGAWREIHS